LQVGLIERGTKHITSTGAIVSSVTMGTMRSLALLVAVGCGRIGFEPTSGTSDGRGDVASDGSTDGRPASGFVEGGSMVVGSTNTIAVTLDGEIAVGDQMLVVVGWSDVVASVAAISDSAGDSFTIAAPIVRFGGLSQVMYRAACLPAASNTITVVMTLGSVATSLRVAIYSGTDTAAAVLNTGMQQTSTMAGAGPIVTSIANTIVVGADTTAGATTSPDPMFTLRLVTSNHDILEDRLAASPGSYAATDSLNTVANSIYQLVALPPR
jgi:hypothetical protein